MFQSGTGAVVSAPCGVWQKTQTWSVTTADSEIVLTAHDRRDGRYLGVCGGSRKQQAEQSEVDNVAEFVSHVSKPSPKN